MLTENDIGAGCEVMTLKNKLIMSGKIGLVGPRETEVYDPDGDLPLVDLNTPVKLIVHSGPSGLTVEVGRVYISNRQFLRLVDLTGFAEYEKRRFFRLEIDHSAVLLLQHQEQEGWESQEKLPVQVKNISVTGMREEEKDGEPAAELPVRVKNISLCGIYFESDHEFQTGEELSLQMTLVHNEPETMDIVIRRKVQKPGEPLGYGAELIDLPARIERNLCAFLFQEQQKQIRQSRSL